MKSDSHRFRTSDSHTPGSRISAAMTKDLTNPGLRRRIFRFLFSFILLPALAFPACDFSAFPPPTPDGSSRSQEPESTTISGDIDDFDGETNGDLRDAPTSPGSLIPAGVYAVKRVVDGDTLLLENGYRVRLLGVDTPETVKPDTPTQPWGREACDHTRQFCASGRVLLEFDREPTDRYGRLLAYAYNPDRDRMLNEELLRHGLGRLLDVFPYSESKKKLFRAAVREAKRERLGIWSGSPPREPGFPTDDKEDRGGEDGKNDRSSQREENRR
ncbi:MAG: thermonuclease family protein [Planctomycetia bacterium]|nr:thermonuclease family protein [Planctomycetia bacterium]